MHGGVLGSHGQVSQPVTSSCWVLRFSLGKEREHSACLFTGCRAGVLSAPTARLVLCYLASSVLMGMKDEQYHT